MQHCRIENWDISVHWDISVQSRVAFSVIVNALVGSEQHPCTTEPLNLS